MKYYNSTGKAMGEIIGMLTGKPYNLRPKSEWSATKIWHYLMWLVIIAYFVLYLVRNQWEGLPPILAALFVTKFACKEWFELCER